LTYQWRKFGAPITGATSDTLTLSDLEMADAGFYDVVIGGDGAFTTSAPARVTVAPTEYLEGR